MTERDTFRAWAARLPAAMSAVSEAGRASFDLILPPRCPETGVIIAGPGGLAADAWRRLHFLSDPCCACCGLPFDVDVTSGTLCAACDADHPAFDRARSVFAYDAHSKSLVLRLKHGDRTDFAPILAGWMARAAAALLEEADVIAPVPLHRMRLIRRRFNQAALLARPLARLCDAEQIPDLLQRVRNTPSQGHLSKLARRRNVAGAFQVRPKYRARLKGRRVLLVDDVFTTGATLGECARVLRRAGADAVDAITVARVVGPRG